MYAHFSPFEVTLTATVPERFLNLHNKLAFYAHVLLFTRMFSIKKNDTVFYSVNYVSLTPKTLNTLMLSGVFAYIFSLSLQFETNLTASTPLVIC